MGNCCEVHGAVDHWIYVKIGDRKLPSTEASLRIIVYDIKGRKSPEIRLNCPDKRDFVRSTNEVFEAPDLVGYDDIDHIELWRDGSLPDAASADFYCQVIAINDRSTERWFYFPVQRWLAPDSSIKYYIAQFGTCLPNADSHKEERNKELQMIQEMYQYGQTAPDLPVQVGMLPPFEQFSDEYKHDIINSQMQLLNNRGVIQPIGKLWTSLEEIIGTYSPALPPPQSVASWSNDVHFGAQRLVGCNPLMVKLCSQLPENMGVTAEMLRPFLEGWTLKQIIDAKRLFLVDLKILEKIPTIENRPLCVPLGLFFVTGDKEFVPIAIQLFQHIAPNNPVFLPSDNQFTWILAKMWFNNADAAVHQALCNFGYTHLLMESACVSIHRHFSPSHPIFKLLAPHFLFLPTINARGLDQLWSQGGWVDKTTSLGRDGMFDLIRRGIDDWRMDIHGTFPKELESRGVLDPRVLPNYSFRDDGMLLYKAIETYVAKVARCYYDSLEKITKDVELQNWAKELSTAKEDGGAGFKGVPGNGMFRRVEELCMVCTSFIFTCTVIHSATNSPQYDEYGFPPNYPSRLNSKPPTDKSLHTEEDIIAALPDKSTTFDVMTITRLFSQPSEKGLADWEFQFQYDPPALKAEIEFRSELQKITETIGQRNRERDAEVKYTHLIPKNITNNVHI